MVWSKEIKIGMVVCLMALAAATAAGAGEVTLRWDPNSEPDVVKYRIYRAELSGVTSAPFERIAEVEGRESTIYTDTVDDARNWVWCVTAVDSQGLESGPSNIAQHYDLVVPIAPRNLRK